MGRASPIPLVSRLRYVRASAALAGLAVVAGALGAHGLEERFVAIDARAAGWWETAVFYHLVHGVVLFVLARCAPIARGPWWCMAGGIAIFSGCLYAMALTGPSILGAIVPVGGVLLVAGWIWLACAPRVVAARPEIDGD